VKSAISEMTIPVVSVQTASFAAGGRAAAVTLPWDVQSTGALGIVARRDFDGALLAAARGVGAHHVPARATAIERATHGWSITAGSTRLTSGWLVGADGANSVVRRLVSSPFPRAELSIATGYFVHGATSAAIAIDFEDVPGGYVWAFPRADHLAVGACGQADTATAASLVARARRWIDRHVSTQAPLERYSWPIPSLGERAILAQNSAGNRWMLVGDAAGLVDPITREGIYFALLSAEHAAESLRGVTAPVAYARRLRETVYDELLRAARLKARFFRPELLSLLVRALGHSARVRAVMADLVSGRQSYAGLRRRLLATLELKLMVDLFRL
jgi:flavin-dependent dehydrogenase